MSSRLPLFALVGRPNVGKSTFFNRLTDTRNALVLDLPGLTRDRQYGRGEFEGRAFRVTDTGGLFPENADGIAKQAEAQARLAITEADRVLFLVDAQAGLMPDDRAIAAQLHKSGKPVTLIANKAESRAREALAEFHALGFGEAQTISAERGEGVTALLCKLSAEMVDAPVELPVGNEIRIAIIGRPNVGKSTLINRLVGEERVLAADQPGTTRDAIEVPFSHAGRDYLLVDTAGVRRKARVEEHLEKLSIVKTLDAIERAHIVIAVADAQAGIGEQDAKIIGLAAHHGRAMIIAVNKWDGLAEDQREWVKSEVDLKLPFLSYAPLHFISAQHGSGLGELMKDVVQVHEAVQRELSTPDLNRVLQQAMQSHQPPAVIGRRIKLRYAHQGGRNPTVIVVHGNQTERLPDVYKRYLANEFRREFNLRGIPLQLVFKTGDNPFKGKKNILSARQQMKRKRLFTRLKAKRKKGDKK
ncbi:MAG: ribosome biogenesis GTPase Der [Pseudomonadota bacterium]